MNKKDIKISSFPIGSEWRRWDLHIHTPESKLGDSFVGNSWDEYLDSLEISAHESEISVIGITDYMTIDGYEKIRSVINSPENPRLTSVGLILPNIEFRTLPSTKDGKALNIHILVDPTDPDHITKINRALRNLQISYKSNEGKQNYGCVREDLINFAIAQDPNIQDDEQAYKFGIQQFKPSYEQIIDWLEGEGWLKNNCLVGITNGKDGISGLPPDGFSATRDQLLKHADFVFSGNPNDREYYLGKKADTPESEIIRMYNGLKPCLHGSDAHHVGKLFKPDGDRHCWIKADPTFEGLRQVLWEPDHRVHIGPTMPQLSDSSRVIKEIRISNDHGWFEKKSLQLNSGLVALIGEKGAGKTAIADLIAFASGVPPEEKSQSSFILKGRLHLSGLRVELIWGSGIKSSGTLIDKPFDSAKPLVRYLSQDFVERLCSVDHQGGELQEAIEEVVFSHLDEVHKEDFSSFAELRAARESASQSRQDDFRGQIFSLHREIERLHASIELRPKKVATYGQTIQQIEEMRKQLPSVVKAADEETLKLLDIERVLLKNVEAEVSKKNRSKRNVDEFMRSYTELKEKITRQVQEIIDSHQIDELLPEGKLKRLIPSWDSDIVPDLSTISKSFGAEISKMRGSAEASETNRESLFEINRRIQSLQESLSKDETNRKRLLDLQKQIAAHESVAKRLTREIEEIDGKIRKQLAQRTQERNQLYLKYFESLSEDEQGLQELYAPMKQQLDTFAADMRFELSAGIRVDHADWIDKANRFFDGRRPAASAKKDEIEKFVMTTLLTAWSSGDLKRLSAAMDEFSELVNPVEFMEKHASPSLKLVELLDWMYSTDHVSVTYKIKYSGTSLEHLSPGTRGIALLVLYLLMDEDDRRPLVIDQPEGNLDNSSIYLQLVPYIRKAKEKRQIILVTHNPNLVVATDADQIIVALADKLTSQAYPRIDYVSGALEHNERDTNTHGIRQAVCTLLEGGDRAFKEREGRYSIRPLSI